MHEAVIQQPDTQHRVSRHFAQALFYATVVPFFLALLFLFGFAPAHASFYANPVQYSITFMATIHVPLTIYLFFDPAIRRRIASDPIKFILIPAAIIIATIMIFVGSAESRITHTAYFLSSFSLAILAWNLWHFGKQNIGVYSYYRLGTLGRMLPAERKMIYTGAILGAIAAIILGFKSNVLQYSEPSGFAGVIPLFGVTTRLAQYVQYLLTLYCVWHIIRHRARFDIKSAILFFLCVNFFLPAYIGMGHPRWNQVFSLGSFAHGIQYVMFLLFHSFYIKDGELGRLQNKLLSIPMMSILLVILMFVCGEFYVFHLATQHINATGWMPTHFWLSFTEGLTNGILLCHFWFDSFFWRFNNPKAREWMKSRYHFLFQA